MSVRYVRHNASVSDPIRDEQTPLVSLGPAGPRVSPIGVGTWQWGERGYWGYRRDYGEDDVRAAYQRARAAGVTLFDTAETYGRGRSEQLLGRFVAERSDVGLVVVATKFAPLPWRARRRGPLRRALEASLGRLGLDSIGLYQIHWPLPLVGDEPWLADLADAAGDALVGAVGVCNYNPAQLRQAHRTLADRGVALATNQVQYSLLDRKPESSGLADLCRELGVTIIAYSPLAQGLLTGKYGPQARPSGVRRWSTRSRIHRVPAVVERLTAIGVSRQAGPEQVALAWLVAKGAVPIPGAKTAAQAGANAGAVQVRLTADEVADLDRVAG